MMRISEVCKALGLSSSTLRSLERRAGLRIGRDVAGHRRYSEADVEVLNKIFYGNKASFPQGEKNEE